MMERVDRPAMTQSPTDLREAHTRLWCLHAIGPDDVHPAPDFDTAQRWANWANDSFAGHADILRHVVAVWPWDAQAHADGIVESIRQWTVPAALSATAPQQGEAGRWGWGYPDGIPNTPEYEPAARICNWCNTVASRCQCDAALAQSPAPDATMLDKVLIWSAEHHAYWRPNSAGYCTDGLGAGVYDRFESYQIVAGCDAEKRVSIREIDPSWPILAALSRPPIDAGEERKLQIGDRVLINADNLPASYREDWRDVTAYVVGLKHAEEMPGGVDVTISERWPPTCGGDHVDGFELTSLVHVPDEPTPPAATRTDGGAK